MNSSKRKKNVQSIAVEAGFQQQQQKTAAITLWPESLHFVQKNYLDFINKWILIKQTNISNLLLGKTINFKIEDCSILSPIFDLEGKNASDFLGHFFKIPVIVLCCLKIGQKHFELSQTLTANLKEKTIQSKELSTTELSFFTDTDLLAFD